MTIKKVIPLSFSLTINNKKGMRQRLVLEADHFEILLPDSKGLKLKKKADKNCTSSPLKAHKQSNSKSR